jgi:stage V sporulation protein B
VLRGYFQGKQNMKPFAFSQVIEQIVRIMFIAVLTKTFLPYGIEYAAAGAMLASIIGELVSLIYLLTMFKLKKHFKFRTKFFSMAKSGKQTVSELMSIALPTTGSRFIGNAAWFLEPIVVVQSLAIAGVSTTLATKQYGELTGYALPLLMLPSFVTASLATSLVPAVSEAKAINNDRLIEHRLQQTMRITFVTGIIAVVILFVLAEPILQVMYGSANAAVFIQFLAPFFLFQYYQMPFQSMLQALNLARAAMFNSFAGAVVKIALIWLLASKESFGIMGAAIGIAAGTILVTLLHAATVVKTIPLTLHVKQYVFPLVAALIAGWCGHISYEMLFTGEALFIRLLLSVLMISVVYIIILLWTGEIRKSELNRIPVIGDFLAKFAVR